MQREGVWWRVKMAIHVLVGFPLIYGVKFTAPVSIRSAKRLWIVGNTFDGGVRSVSDDAA